MNSLHAIGLQQPRVTAVFRDGAQSFLLWEGSTLAELADRIDGLGTRHDGAPIAIHVQFDAPSLTPMTNTSWRNPLSARDVN